MTQPTLPNRTASSGFTLIELMIVVAILAIVASISVPNLLSARMNSNEGAAIATLKSILSAQAQFQATGNIDINNNGVGEYGYFAEMAGAVQLRDASGNAAAEFLRPPVVSSNFGTVAATLSLAGGSVVRSGYIFQMYLPDSNGAGIPEADTGGVNSPAPDPTRSEILWCCYAWPLTHGNSGKRTFFINHTGDLLATRNQTRRYTMHRSPGYDAAFAQGTGNAMRSTVASNTTGNDGQFWKVIN